MNKQVAILGCASNVGKTTITIGLLRLLSQEYNIAPFKALNITGNIGLSSDNKKIALSQVHQAQASYLNPTTLMNPLILEPVNGKLVLSIEGEEVIEKAEISKLLNYASASLKKLQQQHDCIIVEGSGSCCELNNEDIANFGLCKENNIPVILVGDISNCGIFGSIYGTLALLDEKSRSLVKGIIINKFQGDVKYFEEGKAKLEEITNLKVIGVIPTHDIKLVDEDGINQHYLENPIIKVVILKLPNMSNVASLDHLRFYEGVQVSYESEIVDCDLLIIPNTTNIKEDQAYLMKFKKQLNNFENDIVALGGGVQLLGKINEIDLNLLPCISEYHERITFENKDISYEINNELYTLNKRIMYQGDLLNDDLYYNNNNIYGYIHENILDEKIVTGMFLNKILKRKNIISPLVYLYQDNNYDLLADHLSKHLDINYIKNIIEGVV